MENLQNQNQQNNFNQLGQQNPKKQIPSWLGFVIIAVVIIVLFGGVFAWQYFVPKEFKITENSQRLIGGDKDSHGCLPAAGYSWCEVKSKCLRVWEEPCETVQTAGWKTYTNTQYGFEIKYPATGNVDIIEQNPNSESKSSRVTISLKSPNDSPFEKKLYIDINERITMNPCMDITRGGNTSTIQVLINNINFYKIDVNGVYSGNQTRAYADEYCISAGQFEYRLTPILYYSYLSNPPPSSTLETDTDFNQIISTFKFTK